MIRVKHPSVYVLASGRNGTLYVGVTSDLHLRMSQHTEGTFEGFTKRHGIKLLVYYEMLPTMDEALARETRLKKWNRAWKLRLIEEMNPEWQNLYDPGTGEIAFGSQDIEATKDREA